MMKLAILFLCCALLSACSLSLQGDNGLTVAGNSTSNVVTLALDGTVVRGVLTDSGNATGEGNWLSMLGAGNVTISASGSTITITCEGGGGGNATYALDSDKLDGEHGSYYLAATGTAADSTKFYGFTALQWTNTIDTMATADIEAVDIATDSGTANVDAYDLDIIGSGSVSTSASGHVITITGNATATGTSAVKAYRNAAQTITKSTWSLVHLDAELYDVASEFDCITNHRFTTVIAGYYLLMGQVGFYGVTAGKEIDVAISAGSPASSTVYCQGALLSPTSTYPVLVICAVQYLAVGDKVELWCGHADTVDRNLLVNGITSLSVVRLW